MPDQPERPGATDAVPTHIDVPEIRPIQPIPVQKDGKRLVALRDPLMLTQRTMIVPPQVAAVLQTFQGKLSLHEIGQRTGVARAQLLELARNLDQIGLLWGPTFEQLETSWREKLEQEGAFPQSASGALGKDAEACRSRMDEILGAVDDAALEPLDAWDGPIRGLLAGHLTYDQTAGVYGLAYAALRHQPAPDRVVVLGPNSFGLGDGVVLSPYGFNTPLGRVETDTALVGGLRETLGKGIVIDHLDHLPEHSVEVHLPWVQHVLGDVPVVAALVPDPMKAAEDDDDERVSPSRFATVLRETLERADGSTLVIGSVDLSHVGPQFGEPRAVDDRRRSDVEQHDREMLQTYLGGDVDAFVSAIRWNKNPTRWTSLGPMIVALDVVRPQRQALLDYRQIGDQEGKVLVSTAVVAMG